MPLFVQSDTSLTSLEVILLMIAFIRQCVQSRIAFSLQDAELHVNIWHHSLFLARSDKLQDGCLHEPAEAMNLLYFAR